MSIITTFNGITIVSTPAYPAPKSLEITATDFVGSTSNTFSGQQQVQDWGSSMWSASVQLPAMQRTYADDWICCLLQLRGGVNAFMLGDPTGTEPKGTYNVAGTAPLINGANQTGYFLNTKGWVPSTYGLLYRGDWIQVGYRLHKVLDNVYSDASGNATISIYPQLRESPADSSTFTAQNAQGLFRLAATQNKWSINEAAIYGLSFNIREAF